MADPCVQEPAIRNINDKLDELINAMSLLAVQKNEIRHLSKDQEDHKEWLKKLETRMQTVERVDFPGHEARIKTLENKPAQSASKLFWLATAAIMSCTGGAISGVVVFLLTRALVGNQ